MTFFNHNEVNKPVLYLAKPNKDIISRLNEASEIVYSPDLGQLYELSFSLPLNLSTLEENEANLNAEMLMEKMWIKKSTVDLPEEWYIITSRNFDMNEKKVSITARISAMGLSNTSIKGFDTTSVEHPDGLERTAWNLSEIIRTCIDMNEDTSWSLGYVDAKFDLKYREFSFEGGLGELAVGVAEKFGALIQYDTVSEEIHFIDAENSGINKGLLISNANYLKSLIKSTNADEMTTQLALYGAEGLTIREINPTGSTYVEDFSYFLYPFNRIRNSNGTYTIIKSSQFMSDGLANAILDYQELVKNKTPLFKTYINELNSVQEDIATLEIQKESIETEIVELQERADIYLALNGGALQPDLVAEMDAATSALNIKVNEIQVKLNRVAELAGEEYQDSNTVIVGHQGGLIGLLKESLMIRNNFSPTLLTERSRFIHRKDYSDDSIVDAEDLLKEGLKRLEEIKTPALDVTIDIVDLLQMIESKHDWDRFALGDTIRIQDDWKNEVIEAKIIGYSQDYDNKTISVRIANFKDTNDSTAKFMELLYQASFTSSVVSENKYKWDMSKENNGLINAIIENEWDATKQKISGGVSGLTELSSRGLISRDYVNPNEYLVIQNGVLAITGDNGSSWGLALTKRGVVAERLYGKVIAGVNLTIEDKDGYVKMLGNKISISNKTQQEVMKMGLVSLPGQPEEFGIIMSNPNTKVGMTDKDGFYISQNKSGTFEKVLYTQENGDLYVQDLFARNVSINGLKATNATSGVQFDNTVGILVSGTKSDITLNSSLGMKINRKSDNQDVFWIDTNGRLNVRDIVINSGNISWGSVNNQPQSSVSWDQIYGKPTVPNGTYIDQFGLYTGTIAANRISAGTISGLNFNTYDSSTTGQIVMTGGEFTSYKYNTGYAEYTRISNGGFQTRMFSNGSGSYQTITLDGNSGLSFTTTKYPSSRLRIDVIEASNNPRYIVQAVKGNETDASLELISGDSLYLTASGFSGGLGNVYMGNSNLRYQVASTAWVTSNFLNETSANSNYAYKSHSHASYWTKGSDTGYLSSYVHIGNSSIGIGGVYDGSASTQNVSLGVTNIYAPGKVYASGVALTSSVTRKTNIREFNVNAMDIIKGVNVYEYHYINDVDNLNFYNKQIGVLAEGSPAILRGGENDSINTYAMVSVLWRAMQQQQDVIDTLKRDIKDLEEIIGVEVTESY